MGRVYNNIGREAVTPAERERAPSVTHSMHQAQEAIAERPQEVHQQIDPNIWINPVSLNAPPPRPGYVQRWVSDGEGMAPEDAVRQRYRFQSMISQQGWSVRLPETIPEELKKVYLTTKSGSGDDLIRVASLVLCEMPVAIARQRHDALNDLNNRQSQTLPDSLEDLRERSRGTNAELTVENRSSAHQGRRAATMVD